MPSGAAAPGGLLSLLLAFAPAAAIRLQLQSAPAAGRLTGHANRTRCTNYTLPADASLSGTGRCSHYYHFLIDFAVPVYYHIRNDAAPCKVLYVPDWEPGGVFRVGSSHNSREPTMEDAFRELFGPLGLTIVNVNRKDELVAGLRGRRLVDLRLKARGEWSTLPAEYYAAFRAYAQALPGVHPAGVHVTCIKRGWHANAGAARTGWQRRHLPESFYTNLTRDMAARQWRTKVLDLEGMPLHEQISEFYGTRVIVGQHGAGLSNMIFASEGALVVEIGHQIKPCYGPLAARLGLAYMSFETKHRRPDDQLYPKGLADSIHEAIGLYVDSGADAVLKAGYMLERSGSF